MTKKVLWLSSTLDPNVSFGGKYTAFACQQALETIGVECVLDDINRWNGDYGYEALSTYRYDIVVGYTTTEGVARAINRYRAEGNKVVLINWWIDDGYEWIYYGNGDAKAGAEAFMSSRYLTYSKEVCDFIFTSALNHVDFYRRQGLKCYPLSFGINPAVNKPYPSDVRYECDVLFVGTNNIHREHLVKRFIGTILKHSDIKLRVLGADWDNPNRALQVPKPVWGGLLPYEDSGIANSSTKIVLNITTDGQKECLGITARPYEALGSKSFVLTDYFDGLETIFELGKEIETFNNEKELIEKIYYYLEHEDKRRAIGNAGYNRVMRDYTYARRMREVLDIIGY